MATLTLDLVLLIELVRARDGVGAEVDWKVEVKGIES